MHKFCSLLKVLEALDKEHFNSVLSFENKNLKEEYQEFAHPNKKEYSWDDVLHWARLSKEHEELMSSPAVQEFVVYLYAKLAILHQPDGFFYNHQFLTAMRINQFTVSHPILRFQNLPYSSVDLDTTFRQRYKQGHVKLKHRKKYKPHTKVHTELQLLYGEEGNKFVTSAIDNGDLLLIYSFYIPCQDNSHSVNDCASNMADFFASHQTLSGSSPAS